MSTMTGAQGEVATAGERRWLIWSEEHGAWWRPGHAGYTRSMREAGRYGLEEAVAIIKEANRFLPPSRFNEAVVLDPMLLNPMCGAT